MHNRKNIVLMFLIIVKLTNVSIETNDDAEIGESGLNALSGLFNP